MINVYSPARIWRYLLIASSVGLFLMLLLPSFLGIYSGKVSDLIWTAFIVGGLSGLFTYLSLLSKIVTSPEGIECVEFGIRAKARWDKVERVDINGYGFVNLVFKESIYRNRLVNYILRPLAHNKMIQLSPYMDDLGTSNLVKDVASFVPNCNIQEFIVEHKRNNKTYLRVGTIGLYYLGWFFVMVILAFVLTKVAEYLEVSGFSNMTLVSYIMVTSLLIGLFVNVMNLLVGYIADISILDEYEITHKARTHYLSPIVILFLGFIVGLGIWAILNSRSIILPDDDYGIFSLVAMLLGAVSLQVSSRAERLIFRNRVH